MTSALQIRCIIRLDGSLAAREPRCAACNEIFDLLIFPSKSVENVRRLQTEIAD